MSNPYKVNMLPVCFLMITIKKINSTFDKKYNKRPFCICRSYKIKFMTHRLFLAEITGLSHKLLFVYSCKNIVVGSFDDKLEAIT